MEAGDLELAATPPPGDKELSVISEQVGAAGRRARAQRRVEAVRHYYRRVTASTLVPGLGLLRTRPLIGAVILVLFVVTTVLLLVGVLSRGVVGAALSLGLNEGLLNVSLVVIALLGVAWLVGLALTAIDNRPEDVTGIPKALAVLYGLTAWMMVLIPVAEASRYLVIQRSVLTTVFNADRPAGAKGPGGGLDPWSGVGQINILLIGSDAGPDRIGVRPDSTMVASINAQTGDTVLFGVPRNLQNLPIPASNPLSKLFPQGYNCGAKCLFENVWTLGQDNAKLFPKGVNPGLQTTKDIAGAVLGLFIDYTSVIDLSGFTQLVDAMGGVTVNIKERVCIGCKVDSASGTVVGTTGFLEPGVRHLSGYQALWFARSRAMSQDGDFSRMKRQRCLVGALVSQVDPLGMVQRYPALADVLKDNVSIDISQPDLPAWAQLVLKIKEARISSLPITKDVINVTNPDYPKIHQLVTEAIDPRSVAPSPSSTPKPSTRTTPTGPGVSTPSQSPSTQVGAESLAATC